MLITDGSHSIVWERPNFYSSPAISRSLDAGLDISGVTTDQIDLFDLYSFVYPPNSHTSEIPISLTFT
jgi:hypothetical protein